MAPSSSNLQGTIPLDDVDWRILDALADDARMTNAALAETVGLPASTCLHRVRSLTRQGVIAAYHSRIDRHRLGLHLEVLIGLGLTDKRQRAVTNVIVDIKKLPHVSGLMRTSGPFDLMVNALVANTDDLVTEVINPLTENAYVGSTQTLMVVEHWQRLSLQGDFFLA